MARPNKNGDPTKSDTTRLVNYSDSLVQALIDAGYVESVRGPAVNLSNQKEEIDREYIDVDDIIDGMVDYPLFASTMDDLLPANEYGSLSGYEVSKEKQKKIANGLKPFVDFINNNLPQDLQYLRQEITADFTRLAESSNEGFEDFEKKLERISSRLKRFIYDASEEAERKGEAVPQFVSKAIDDYRTVVKGTEYGTAAPRALALTGRSRLQI